MRMITSRLFHSLKMFIASLVVIWLIGCSFPLGRSTPGPIVPATSDTATTIEPLKMPGVTDPSTMFTLTQPAPAPVSTATSPLSPTYTPAPSEISGFVVFDRLVEVVHFTSQIFLADLDTGENKQLTTGVGSNHTPVWSPDGSKIAFVSSRNEDDDLYIMDKDGRHVTQLTHYKGNELSPDWSPNGQELVFTSDHNGGNDEIYTIDIHTRQVHQLSNNAGIDFDPKWSSDGNRIVFTSDRMDNVFQIYVMNRDGTNVTRLNHDGIPSTRPVWCPDDTCIIYEQGLGLRNRILKLVKIDLESGTIRRLLQGSHETDASVNEWYPAKSPVRGYISFTIGDLLYAYDTKSGRLSFLGLQVVGAALYP